MYKQTHTYKIYIFVYLNLHQWQPVLAYNEVIHVYKCSYVQTTNTEFVT